MHRSPSLPTSFPRVLRGSRIPLALVALAAAWLPARIAPDAAAQDASDSRRHGLAPGFAGDDEWSADRWWQEISRLRRRDPPPADSRAIPGYVEKGVIRLSQLSSAIEQFLEQFPADLRGPDAVRTLTQAAVGFAHYTTEPEEVDKLQEILVGLADRDEVSDSTRLAAAESLFQVGVMKLVQVAVPNLDLVEAHAKDFLARHPESQAGYTTLLYVAMNREKSGREDARRLYREIGETAPDGAEREMARGALRRLDVVGTTPEIRFTSVEGAEVDLAKLRGTVVLLHFWAASDQACLDGLAHLRRVYEEFQPRGVAILGISLDERRSDLMRVCGERDVRWPQHFGGGRRGRIATHYGIMQIPSVWLIDKQGTARFADPPGDMAPIIRQLLAE